MKSHSVILLSVLCLAVEHSPVTAQTFTPYYPPTPDTQPLDIAAGPDGQLWFAESNAGKIAKVTTAGVFTEYQVPNYITGLGPIVAGLDGNMWFATGAGIAKITPSGTITHYNFPTLGNNGACDLTVGPDGNVWYLRPLDKLGMVTTDGVFTEYTVPVGGDSIDTTSKLSTGPDGRLWFTYNAHIATQIGAVTTTGVFAEYPVPNRGYDIAEGPDGNLWYTSPDANRIGKLTTGGVVTEYEVPTPNSQPGSLAVGPDGDLWFGAQLQIGRVSTAGVFAMYTLPFPGVPGPISVVTGLTTGPDGNVWFTEVFRNRIVRFDPDPTSVCGDGVVYSGLEQCDDGNHDPADGCDSVCLLESEGASETSSTGPFSITTDGENDDATPGDPVETTVSSANAGTITITESSTSPSVGPDTVPLTGSVAITAPGTTPENPLRLEFILDASLQPSAGEITWLRNGVPVPPCTGASGEAAPNPCVDSVTSIGDDLLFVILTSAASTWQAVTTLCSGPDAVKPRLMASNLQAPLGDDKFSIQGEALVPLNPEIDPLNVGLRVLLTGTTGASIFDVTIPSGGYDTVAKAGWKVNRARTAWMYKGPGTTTGGIRKISIKTKASAPGELKFKVTGRDGSLPVAESDVPVSAMILVNWPADTTEQCVVAEFPATAPATPSCTFTNGSTLRCQ